MKKKDNSKHTQHKNKEEKENTNLKCVPECELTKVQKCKKKI